MADHNRRAADKHPLLDIDAMILSADDPKDRALLMILNNINTNMIASTKTISEIGDRLEAHIMQFESHTEAESEMLNKGKGAWKVAAWVIGLAQIVGVIIWKDARTEIAEIHTMVQKEQVQLGQLESRVLFVEKVAK